MTDTTAESGWDGTRVWTPEAAAGALPLVRRIVDDLVVGYRMNMGFPHVQHVHVIVQCFATFNLCQDR